MDTSSEMESRILIVEDEKPFQRRLKKQIQRALEDKEFKKALEPVEFRTVISIATNVQEARDLLEHSSLPFNLVTMDINLSEGAPWGTEGMDLLRLIEDKLSNTYVVVVSGEDRPEQMGEIFGLSRVVGYVRKAALSNDVIHAIAQIAVLHVNSLRRIQDPRLPYKEWKRLPQWIKKISELQEELVDKGGPTLKFPESIQREREAYSDRDTELPGQKAVKKRLRLLCQEDVWTMMVVQIDQLDSFAKIVGGEMSKAAALYTAADVAGDVLEKAGGDRSFVGCRGDKIIVVTDLQDVAQVSSDIRKAFIAKRMSLYSQQDHTTSDGQLKEMVKVKAVKASSGETGEVMGLPWIDVKIGTITRQEMDEYIDVSDVERAIAATASLVR